jgi:peptidoglycan hydrolase CwlO-like protein
MKYFYAIVIALSSCCSQLLATETIFIGGGGDPEGPTTIFDESLKALALSRSAANLNLRVAFNGGHATTESLVTSGLGLPQLPFTAENYEKIISEYAEKIKNGSIKPGEKLLVMVDTHGGEKQSAYKTHSIALTGAKLANMSQISGNASSSMDKLQILSDLARQKGIKLGIIDFSCHSGNSLPLANDNTCVIAASGANHFGYGTFAEEFIANMAKGKSLEEIYLSVRSKYDLPSFPEISTSAGRAISSELYPLISPYINTVNDLGNADKLSPYLKSLYGENQICIRESNFDQLVKKITALQNVVGQLKSKYAGMSDLLEALKSYKKEQDKYLSDLDHLEYPLLQTKEKIVFRSSFVDKRARAYETEDFSWATILTSYPTSSIDYFKSELSKAKGAAQKEDLLSSIDKFQKIDQVRQKILSEHPKLNETNKYFSQLKDQSGHLWNITTKITELSNKLYDQEYKEASERFSKNINPCKDFVL